MNQRFGILYRYGLKKIPIYCDSDITKNYIHSNIDDDDDYDNNSDFSDDHDCDDCEMKCLVHVLSDNESHFYLMSVTGPDTYDSYPTTFDNFYKELNEYHKHFDVKHFDPINLENNDNEINIFTQYYVFDDYHVRETTYNVVSLCYFTLYEFNKIESNDCVTNINKTNKICIKPDEIGRPIVSDIYSDDMERLNYFNLMNLRPNFVNERYIYPIIIDRPSGDFFTACYGGKVELLDSENLLNLFCDKFGLSDIQLLDEAKTKMSYCVNYAKGKTLDGKDILIKCFGSSGYADYHTNKYLVSLDRFYCSGLDRSRPDTICVHQYFDVL